MRQEQLDRMRRTQRKGETSSFACFLVYFLVKALFLISIYKYQTVLNRHPSLLLPLTLLLIANTYLMLTTGSDPGQEKPAHGEPSIQEGQRLVQEGEADPRYCKVCRVVQTNRMKHCYYCGACTRKFDHHCPWIGGCVGQKNHCKFWLLLLTHTIQATLAFYICYSSLPEGISHAERYGVFATLGGFMVLYICFAGSLLIFQSYLILSNTTSKQLFQRNKCLYLRGIEGNPFDKGWTNNVTTAVWYNKDGQQWHIDSEYRPPPPNFLQLMWSNEYYSCC